MGAASQKYQGKQQELRRQSGRHQSAQRSAPRSGCSDRVTVCRSRSAGPAEFNSQVHTFASFFASSKRSLTMNGTAGVMQHWQQGPLGRGLIAAEAQLLATTFDDVFGQELLQLGTWGLGRELLAQSRIRRQSVIGDRETERNCVDLVANLAHLPINGASVDAVLLPHTLEYAPDPYAVLREADRVLVAEGQLIVLGFRPASLWGLRSAASRAGYPPGLRRQLGSSRVHDWLGLLSYEIVAARRLSLPPATLAGRGHGYGGVRHAASRLVLPLAGSGLPDQGAQARLHPDTDQAAPA